MQIHPISASLSGLTLSTYNENDIRGFAACQIVSEQGLDKIGFPIRGGYYDPAMGPRNTYDICETCGLQWRNCPGHVGYIELPVYCYNHFFFNYVLQLYKITCHSCYRFLITDLQALTLETGLLLLDAGYICDMHYIFTILNNTLNDSVAVTLARLRQKAYVYLSCNWPSPPTSNTLILRNKLKSFFLRLKPPSSCPHCAAPCLHAIHRSTYNIYLIPPKPKSLRSLSKKKQVRISADEAQDDNNDVTKSTSTVSKSVILNEMLYCTPLMVLKELTSAVSKTKDLIDLLFGEQIYRGNGSESVIQLTDYSPEYISLRSTLIKNILGDAAPPLIFPRYRREFLPSSLFIKTLLVPPNRQRPSILLNSTLADHPMNTHLLPILTLCNAFETMKTDPQLAEFVTRHVKDDLNVRASQVASTVMEGIDEIGGIGMFRSDRYNYVKDPELAVTGMTSISLSKKPIPEELLESMLTLQVHVSRYLDGTVSARSSFTNGIKQLLERKMGLFRMNIMGKRGNYAGRSVIAPDANLDTDEIGLPEYFAKKLTFPEPINEYNVDFMAKLILNGPTYPGASVLIDERGSRILLTELSYEQRKTLAHTLLVDFSRETIPVDLETSEETTSKAETALAQTKSMRSYDLHGRKVTFPDSLRPPKILLRHTLPNDFVILNRQPTLHKHSMVALRVRVLPSNAQALRFHFASCKGLNADFDGDECCVLKPQTHEAVSEYANLIHADSHFISVTSGEPIRGLIQDHIIGGIFLCSMGVFFDFGTVCEYIMVATGSNKLSTFEQSFINNKSKERLLALDVVSQQTTSANLFTGLNELKYMGTIKNQKLVRAKCDVNHNLSMKYNESSSSETENSELANTSVDSLEFPKPPPSFFVDYIPPIDVQKAPVSKADSTDGFHTKATAGLGRNLDTGKANAFATEKVTVLPDSCVFSEENENIMVITQPCIVYPAPRWTGKAVISSMLHKVSCGRGPINYTGTVKVPTEIWGPFQDTESKVVILNNTLLTGIIEKQHVSTTPHGLSHAIFELYGHNRCGWFLSNFGRLATYVLQRHGLTCSVEDMLLQKSAEQARQDLCTNLLTTGAIRTAEFLCEYLTVTGLLGNLEKSHSNFLLRFSQKGSVQLEQFTDEDRLTVYHILRASLILDKTIEARLDSYISNEASIITTNLMKSCKPSNLVLKMHSALSSNNPYGTLRLGALSSTAACTRNIASQKSINSLAYMVLSGAKGSTVNLQMMTTCLGQQNLEGRRVPSTATGRTLPSHVPYEHCEFIQGGYVCDRFLTGIRPASFFFHCQAGREGLIDTAIKTATSGYFQRVLVKNLEGLSVAYDGTVRRSDNSLVQLLYGGDGIDTSKTGYLREFEFMSKNEKLYLDRFLPALHYNNEYFTDSEEITSLVKKVRHDLNKNDPTSKDCQALRMLYEKYAGIHSYISLEDIIKDAGQLASALHTAHEETAFKLTRSRDLLQSLNIQAYELVKKYVSTYKQGLENANLLTKTSVLQPTQKERQKLIKYLKAIYMPRHSKDDNNTVFDGITTQELSEIYQCFQTMPIHTTLSPYLYLGSTPPSFSEALDQYIENRLKQKKVHGDSDFDPAHFRLLAYTRFIRSLIAPGSAVGVIAAQSTGEPSTQLTLNTFHLAGHGGVNATMGVPRLREIIMTRNTSAPIITLYFRKECQISIQKSGGLHRKTIKLGPTETLKACKALQQQLKKVYLRDVLRSFSLKETPMPDGEVKYDLTMRLLTLAELSHEFNFNASILKKLICLVITKYLARMLTKEILAHKATIQNVHSKLPTESLFTEYADKSSKSWKAGVKSDDTDHEENENSGSSKEDNDEESSLHSEDSQDSLSSERQDKDKSQDPSDDDQKLDVSDLNFSENGHRTYNNQDIYKLINSNEQIDEKAKEFFTNWALTDTSELLETAQKTVNTPFISLEDAFFTLENTGLAISPDQMPLSVKLTFINKEPSHILALANIEKAIRSIVLKEVRGITRCFIRHELPTDRYVMDIEGGNLRALFYLTSPFIALDNIYTNSVSQVLEIYGIEAARNAIFEEVHRVFKTYHIEVDERHLSLIADHMTTSGTVRSLNRLEMLHQSEELLKASFESACTSIAAGALASGTDTLRSPASAVTVGQYPSQGTGSFDLFGLL